MAKYTALAQDILDHVGGAENVNSLKHCVTRLRFSLKDEGKADTDYLKQLDGVVTVVQAGGQYQVVIGNHVPEVYAEVLKVGNLQGSGTVDADEEGPKGNLFDRFVDLVSGIFQPFLGPLAAAGIIKGIVAILAVTGMSHDNSALYAILETAGDGFFQFLPMLIAITSARKFKMNEFTALAIAGALVYPTLPATIATLSEAKLAHVLGIPFELPSSGSYLQTVMPAILAIWVASHVEKFMKKITPDVVKLFVVPFVTLLVTVPLTFLVVGPVANIASDLLSGTFTAIMGFSPLLYGLLLGALWQVLVMFGLHWALVPLAILQLPELGWTTILIPASLPNFTQTGVLAAIYLKTKEQKVKTLTVPAFISSLFGVTEPAIYGITLPMKTPFYISCVVSGLVGAALSFFDIKGYSFGALGIFQYPAYVGPDGLMPMWIMIGFSVVAIVVSFAIQMALPVPTLYAKAEVAEPVASTKTVTEQVIASPLSGEVIALEDTPDAVFASGAMGRGIAVEPSLGEVVAPADGFVRLLFPTNHAIGLATEDGTEILIHVGMDTVALNGEGFTAHVTQGSRVRKGQLLLTFDIEKIKAAGYPVTTPVIVTTPTSDVQVTDADTVNVGDYLLTAIQ
ncbi:beta-glucoside-specific PTS transporter subunit IIABC [Streptococcus himalayensis]|uniref:PTS system sucrose-specific EIIBCA component n=1 Tax=Streptococcus himalayensis TaxID=1888195 RepID=A0A917A7L6_9STRE|nr:beta-glucoside-specific PTS transporter subunit IIABC [Streptococcus himalayensis]GGE32179.1 PTS beta-glucoside transporter subunit EIIBCA [Streptococcus himalayensis]